jgi:hypothetical protein
MGAPAGIHGGLQWRRLPKKIMGEEETEALKILNAVKTKWRAAGGLVGLGHGAVGIGLAVCSGWALGAGRGAVVAWSGRASALRGSSRG